MAEQDKVSLLSLPTERLIDIIRIWAGDLPYNEQRDALISTTQRAAPQLAKLCLISSLNGPASVVLYDKVHISTAEQAERFIFRSSAKSRSQLVHSLRIGRDSRVSDLSPFLLTRLLESVPHIIDLKLTSVPVEDLSDPRVIHALHALRLSSFTMDHPDKSLGAWWWLLNQPPNWNLTTVKLRSIDLVNRTHMPFLMTASNLTEFNLFNPSSWSAGAEHCNIPYEDLADTLALAAPHLHILNATGKQGSEIFIACAIKRLGHQLTTLRTDRMIISRGKPYQPWMGLLKAYCPKLRTLHLGRIWTSDETFAFVRCVPDSVEFFSLDDTGGSLKLTNNAWIREMLQTDQKLLPNLKRFLWTMNGHGWRYRIEPVWINGQRSLVCTSQFVFLQLALVTR